MFYDCSSLSKLDFSNFNTEDFIIMSNLFEGCTSLSNLDISKFNTNNVKYMENIFAWCSSLSNLDLFNFIQKMLLTRMECFFLVHPYQA